MTPRRATICLMVTLMTVSLWPIRSSEALAAFARREGANCRMCHSGPPESNEDGRAYVHTAFPDAGRTTASLASTDHGMAPSAPAVDHGMTPSQPALDHGMTPSAKPRRLAGTKNAKPKLHGMTPSAPPATAGRL